MRIGTTRMEAMLDEVRPHPLAKGWHTEAPRGALFIDGCVQIWEDADYASLHRYPVSAYMVTGARPHDGLENAIDAMMNWHRIARTYPRLPVALTAKEIEEAHARGDAAIVIGVQGGEWIGQNILRLEVMHRLGLRVMIPSYNERNSLCDGQMEPANAGLSKLGRKWVAECNRLGIVMDLTHTGFRSAEEIMDLSAQPVVFTHSNPSALVEHPRNIPDHLIRRCAATGGTVGITNWGPLNFKAGSGRRPKLENFLDAVSYTADLIGADRVTLGTDMSHGTYPDGDLIRGSRGALSGGEYGRLVDPSPRSRLRQVEGFDDYGQIPQVAEAMERRGFSRAEVEGILGLNLLRVFRQVWGA